MTDGSVSGGGTIGGVMSPVDWSYPTSLYNSNDYSIQDYYNFDDDDEDDLDSYYMDLPPIDMTERLREVNRALAEDSTPIESNRTTKLRFREVIAEYQSPRESVLLSDSDDGYGDSSDIMYDPEEDNDILYSSSKNGCQNITLQDELPESNQPSAIHPGSSDESDKEKNQTSEVKRPPLLTNWVSSSEKNELATSTCSSENKSEVVKTILKADSSTDKVILEDFSSSDLCSDSSSWRGGVSSSSKTNCIGGVSFHANTNSAKDAPQKLFVHSKSNGRFSKCSKKDHDLSELDSEVEEELDVFSATFNRRDSLTDDAISDDTEGDSLHKYNDTNINSGTKVKLKAQSNLENRLTIDTKNSFQGEDAVISKLPLDQISIRDKKVEDRVENSSECDKSKTNKLSKAKVPIDRSPTKNITSKSNVRLSSSQPIPTIKSSLINPQKLPFTPHKSSKGTRTPLNSNPVSSFIRPSRSRSTVSSRTGSPTKSPLSNPVQSTRPQTARKGSPLPRRSVKMSEKKPMKAIHNQNGVPIESSQPFRLTPNSSAATVRKAASTSDLSRGCLEEQQQINEAVYERWLHGKIRNASLTKKQREDVKAAGDAAATAKLKERRRLAEEAFQQWLRRKRDQLREEKRCRAQQRKLDQQANYARTRTQCEEAYAEWCKRKQEEVTQSRRVNGSSNGRSRSLERTWIQEKTRKLYRAYLTTH